MIAVPGEKEPASRWGTLPLITGLFMALAATAVALAIYLIDGVGSFPEILYACARNGMNASACSTAAMKAGLVTFVFQGTGLLLLLGAACFLSYKPAPPLLKTSTEAEKIIVLSVLVLLLVHMMRTVFSLPVSSRPEEINRFSFFLSTENAFWPLLLQLYVINEDNGNRPLLFAALMGIVMLSPFRAVGMAVALLGFLLPLAEDFLTVDKSGMLDRVGPGKDVGKIRKATLAALVSACVLLQGGQDTSSRGAPVLMLSDMPEQLAQDMRSLFQRGDEYDDGKNLLLSSKKPRLHQRLLYPIVQAGIVEHLAGNANLPSPITEIKRKLRLTEETNLNEFVYQRIYGGKGIGETTSLVYGEAMAYFPDFPMAWMAFVPLGLLALWYFLRRAGVQTATLASLALWRSSFAGLVTIIPGLVFQTGAYLASLKAGKFSGGGEKWSLRFGQAADAGLAALFSALVFVQVFLMLGFLLSEGSVEASITAKDTHCFFDRVRTENALSESIGGEFRYDFTLANRYLLSVVVPDGKGHEARLRKVMDSLDRSMQCSVAEGGGKFETGARIIKTVSIKPRINAVHVLTFAATLFALFRVGRGFWPSFLRRFVLRRRNGG